MLRALSTVSRVVNGSPNVSDEAKARVEAVVRQTGYRPHAAARTLAANRAGSMDTGQTAATDQDAARSETGAGRKTAELLDERCGVHDELQEEASYTETIGCESCGATLGAVT